MIKVHVGEDDVPDVFRLVSQSLHLIDRRFVWIKWHFGNDAEELGKPGWVGIIIQSKACIYKNRSLICFNQQTNHARFQISNAGIAGEAVEQVNGHENI